MNIATRPIIVLMLALFLCSAPRAHAQEREQKEHMLQSVTVTAQKREENVQEVPSSVGVLDDVALEEERIHDLMDIDDVIPNLYMSSMGGAATYSFAGIRGRISTDGDVDPTVTVLVDGVPYDDIFSMAGNLLFDVERVEVLRGPQSTMYGLNSTAGVINIVTQKPGDVLRAHASAEVSGGQEYDGSWMLNGSVSGPLVPGKLAGGLAFMTEGTNGYVKNLHTGDPYNADTKSSGRGTLVWTPTDAWDIELGLTYTDIAADYGYLYLPVDDAVAENLGLGEWEQDLDWEGSSEVRTLGTHLTASYDAGPVDLTSITTYRHSEQEYDLDFDYTSAPNKSGAVINDFETFSQELRLQSSQDLDSPLEWLVGFFHHRFLRNQDLSQTWYAGTGWPGYYPAVDTRLGGDSNALFGQATYRLLDRKLGLTLGLRQEWTSRELHDRLDYLPDMDTTDSQFLPKFAVDYRVTPQSMIYGSVAQAWRSGGYYNMSYQNSDPDKATFKKETSWTYEVGTKNRFLDNRLLINAAVFHTVYDDYQDMVVVNFIETYLLNAGEVTMTGFEVETEALLTENLRLTGSFGYVHGEYEDFSDDEGNYSGKTVISAPDYDFNVALKYSFLDGFYVRPEVQGVGTIYWDRSNEKSQAPYCLLNFRTGYEHGDWELYVYGENLTNEYAFTRAGNINGVLYGAPITPFKAGLGVNWNF